MKIGISEEQRVVFRSVARERFAVDMAAHAREYQPLLCESFSDTELRAATDPLIAQAASHGFTKRGQAKLFVELGLLYGSSFVDDPQVPWIAEVLADPAIPFPEGKARALHRQANEHLDKVFGQNGEYAHAARKRIGDNTEWPTPTSDQLEDYLLTKLEQIHPEKVAYTGKEPLRALIVEARSLAKKWEMNSPRAAGVMAVLMNQFGHGCDVDPFYPWINRTLTSERIKDGETRAEKLEERARTWMRIVLERADKGGYA